MSQLRPEISKYLAKRVDGFRWACVSRQLYVCGTFCRLHHLHVRV